MTISERSTEILKKFVFLNKFEKEQIMMKIWICLNKSFLKKPEKRGQILTKTGFSPPNELHRAKLWFPVVFIVFGEIH